jgi:hypothetical protein
MTRPRVPSERSDEPSSARSKEIWDEEAEVVVTGVGEGGELAVWKLRGEAECTLEALEVEKLRDNIIRKRKKRDWMEY